VNDKVMSVAAMIAVAAANAAAAISRFRRDHRRRAATASA